MRKKDSHSVDTIFVLSLFCVFAVAVLLMLIMGTQAYSKISDRTDDTFYRRTAISYIAEKIRHSDREGAVFVSDFDGIPALELRQEIEGISFSTYTFFYEGEVRELFCETGLDLPADSGNSVIEGSALSFEKIDNNLLKVCYADPDGRMGELVVALRSEGALG